MAKSAGGGGPDTPDELPQHPLVEQLKPDPSQPAKRVIVLTGLPGNSDRAGYQRLYLTTKLDYYAEFLVSDMAYSEAVPADQSPFYGQGATQVSISRDATIHYIWARSPQPADEFDLDIRLGAPAGAAGPAPGAPPPGVTDTCGNTCLCPHTLAGQNTCPHTHCGNTCATCVAAQATCAGHGTCVNTACIATCNTQCAQATCANTQCNQYTCVTCANVNTCANTCYVA